MHSACDRSIARAGKAARFAGGSYQVTIRDLLVLVAASSVVAGLAVNIGVGRLSIRDLVQLGMFGSWFAALTVIASIAAMAVNRIALAATFGIAGATACGYALAGTASGLQFTWSFVAMMVIAAIVQLIVLSGYRRRLHGPGRHEAGPSTSAAEPEQLEAET